MQKLLGILLLFLLETSSYAQAPSNWSPANITLDENSRLCATEQRPSNVLRAMFWNVENLFNPKNDSLKNDEDFTPEGKNGWSWHRYNEKIKNIYKIYMAVGGFDAPDFIGMCEVECREAINDLISRTPLAGLGYQVAHFESPDRRGIDVGFLYKAEKFRLIKSDTLRIRFPFDTATLTRDVLVVSGVTNDSQRDTLHFFINHWPSRLGGQEASEPKRIYVALRIKKKIEQLRASMGGKMILMGDFNDGPTDASLQEALGARIDYKKTSAAPSLINLMGAWLPNHHLGSHKYQGHWGILDQFIVSDNLLNEQQKGYKVKAQQARIFSADFMLQDDARFFGKETKRTFEGPSYKGGFSDHLPIFIDLVPSL